jgi:hypothetical protein
LAITLRSIAEGYMREGERIIATHAIEHHETET